MTPDPDQPQYGQRATPEEQARAVAQSGGVQEWQKRAAIPPAHERHTPDGPPAAGVYTINRLVTLILLGIGLIAVVQSAFGYLDIGSTIQTLYTEQGIGEYTTTDLTRTIGISLIVMHAALWIATAWVSVRVLARGRTAWWIPLVGALANFITMAVLLAVLLLADPAFLSFIGAA